MTWRDRTGEVVHRKSSDEAWPLFFLDRPRPEPEPAENVVPIKGKAKHRA